MITVTFCGNSYDCVKAIKGNDYIHLLNEDGVITAAFTGITDFSGFEITGGSFSPAADENDCNILVAGEDGVPRRSNIPCEKLDKIEDEANKYILPEATTEVLGGVKVGSGLSVKDDGTLSADSQTENSYTTAEKNKLAGIESGAQKNAVTSVAGKTGAVTLTNNDVGLGKVDNTSDLDKPISTATQTALNSKVSAEGGSINNTTVSFAQDSGTDNINSGEKTQVLFGKISKWLSRLKALAFKDTISDSDISSNANISQSKINGLTAIQTKLNGIDEGANKYALPTASSDTLGGVKVGETLSISDGVLDNADDIKIVDGCVYKLYKEHDMSATNYTLNSFFNSYPIPPDYRKDFVMDVKVKAGTDVHSYIVALVPVGGATLNQLYLNTGTPTVANITSAAVSNAFVRFVNMYLSEYRSTDCIRFVQAQDTSGAYIDDYIVSARGNLSLALPYMSSLTHNVLLYAYGQLASYQIGFTRSYFHTPSDSTYVAGDVTIRFFRRIK